MSGFNSLIGRYSYTIDPKGRVFLPPKFREALGENFVVMRGTDARCLMILSTDEMEEMGQKLAQLPKSGGSVRDFMRRLYSSSFLCECDKQGRVLLPADLREFASLTRDVVVIGMMTQVEIWDAEKWQEHSSKVEESFPEILPIVAQHGI